MRSNDKWKKCHGGKKLLRHRRSRVRGPQSGTCLPLTFTQSQLGVVAMEWARILDKCNRASFMHVTASVSGIIPKSFFAFVCVRIYNYLIVIMPCVIRCGCCYYSLFYFIIVLHQHVGSTIIHSVHD